MTATPNYIVTTGDFIAEWMEDAGINAAELARRLDVTPKHVSELLNGKAPLSAHLALALERVTGVPARLWNMYEAGYREDLARQETVEDLDAQYEQAKAFPLGYLRKFGYIKASARDHAGTVRELLTLLGVASFDAWRATWAHGSVAYRRTAAGRDDAPALSVWLTIAEREADPDSLAPYDDAALRELVPRLRALTVGDPASPWQRRRDCSARSAWPCVSYRRCQASVFTARPVGLLGIPSFSCHSCGSVTTSSGSLSSTS